MATKKKYDPIIDEYDLKKIWTKISDVNKIIYWLGYLGKLDESVKTDVDFDRIMRYLKSKVKKLEKKYNQAQTDMVAEAELLNDMFI